MPFYQSYQLFSVFFFEALRFENLALIFSLPKIIAIPKPARHTNANPNRPPSRSPNLQLPPLQNPSPKISPKRIPRPAGSSIMQLFIKLLVRSEIALIIAE